MPNTTETDMSAAEPGASVAATAAGELPGSGSGAENMSSAASVSSVASVGSSAGSERSSSRSMPPPSKLPGLVKATVAKPKPPGAASGIRPPGSLSASSSVSGSNTSLSRVGRTGRLCDGHPKKDPTPSPGTPNGPTANAIRKLSDDFARSTKLSDLDDPVADAYSAYSERRRSSDRRSSNASAVLTEDTDSFIIGERVYVGGTKPGRLAYIGDTQFAPGEWAGVVLDEPIGKNDGSVGGVRYFQCEAKKGVFSRLTRLTRYPLPESALSSLSTSSLLTSPTTPVTRKAAPRLGAAPTPAPKAASPTPTLSPSGSVRSLAAGAELKLGERVIVMSSQTGSKAGVLRYKGPTAFAAGEWCGVELDDPMGKNDGSVAGTRYFDCEPKFGLFAPVHKVSRSPAPKRMSTANCKVHHSKGLHGSRESLSSIVSARSSIGGVSTAGSTREKLGVTALTDRKDLYGTTPSPTPCNCTIHLNPLPKYKLGSSAYNSSSCNCTIHLLKTSTPGLRTTPTSTSLRSGLQDNYFNNYNNYNKYTYTYNYDINWEDCY
ncbi:restin homolog isoform X3 [Frankliniella occidentalis]|uniref:Restin homolog isoform X3 n=1 Tax=Frankliniella occidentalis TaxID=133901 RepID=A0A9C6X5U8_FRAOC|nr:restin homolog isoform X3 [Frankliniella occidentalis]